MQLQELVEVIARFGFTVLKSAIQIKHSEHSRSRAVIKISDSTAAKLIAKKLYEKFRFNKGLPAVKRMQNTYKYRTRLELYSVNCF